MNNGGFELSKSLLYLYIINKNEEIMKIKTKNEQLEEEIDKLNKLIDFSEGKSNKAYQRLTRKQNWGLLSFITDPEWLLHYERNNTLDIFHRLQNYRDMLIEETKLRS